jgi:hypothetical protein
VETYTGNITEFHLNFSLTDPIVLPVMVSLLWDVIEKIILVYMPIVISLNVEALLIVEVMPSIAISTTIPLSRMNVLKVMLKAATFGLLIKHS